MSDPQQRSSFDADWTSLFNTSSPPGIEDFLSSPPLGAQRSDTANSNVQTGSRQPVKRNAPPFEHAAPASLALGFNPAPYPLEGRGAGQRTSSPPGNTTADAELKRHLGAISSRLDKLEAQITTIAEHSQQFSTSSSQTKNGIFNLYRNIGSLHTVLNKFKDTSVRVAVRQLEYLQRMDGKGADPHSQDPWAPVSGNWGGNPDMMAM